MLNEQLYLCTSVYVIFGRPLKDVRSMITQPNMYALAQSHSSVKDQALYSSARVEHLAALKPSVTQSGVEYRSVMKLGLGMFGKYLILLQIVGRIISVIRQTGHIQTLHKHFHGELRNILLL